MQDSIGLRGADRRFPINSAGTPASTLKLPLLFLGVAVWAILQIPPAWAQRAVLTRSFNNARTGANISEMSFTPQQVLSEGLTKRFSLTLSAGDDPRIEAQPLYVPGITMNDGQKHDVLYVFSMTNKVYAFDANTGATIWQVSLGPWFIPDPNDPVDVFHINKAFGILSTPVIDPESQVMYVVNWLSDDATHQARSLRVNAVRLSDGKPPDGKQSALPIQASVTNQAGQVISLNQVQKQRAALLLVPLDGKPTPPAHKMLYVAMTGDEAPPANGDATKSNHGWVIAFDVDAWKQTATWLATPSSFGGGIWEGSQGPAADLQGNVYLMTANGGYTLAPQKQDFNGTTDFAESFVKLSYSDGSDGPSLKLTDWFIPFRDSERRNWHASEVAPFPSGYDYTDQDLGSAGPVVITGLNLVVGAGKDGVLYVLDKDNFGKAVADFSKLKAPPVFFTYDPDPAIAAFQQASPVGNLDFKPMLGVKTHHLHGSPVYWNSAAHGPMLFGWGENGVLRALSLSASGQAKLVAQGLEFASENLADPENNSLGGMPGAMLALSSKGGADGIVWATAPLEGDASAGPVAGIVRAYDAARFAASNPNGVPRLRKLWQATGFTYSKFCPPVVADGKLFVPTYDGRVDVYTLPPPSSLTRKAPR